MNNKGILYKNEKLTKRLIEIKILHHKLSIKDKLILFFLKKYNIPYGEMDIIDEILRHENHIRCETRITRDEFNNIHHRYINPRITEHGINAIKNDYYEVNIITNVLKTPQTIMNIILVIVSIILGVRQLILDNTVKNLEKEIKLTESVVDSLRVELISLQKIHKIQNVNNDQSINNRSIITDTLKDSIQPPNMNIKN